MTPWRQDKAKADRFMPDVKRILLEHCVVIREGTFAEDTQQGTDLRILTIAGRDVAVRIRNLDDMMRYPFDVTIRYRRKSGVPTEFDKIGDGKTDLMFYGFANVTSDPRYLATETVHRWIILDVSRLRKHWGFGHPIVWATREKWNAGGESSLVYFRTSPVGEDVPADAIVAHSAGYFDDPTLPYHPAPDWLGKAPKPWTPPASSKSQGSLF